MNALKLIIFILWLLFSTIYSQPFDFTYPINITNVNIGGSSFPSLFIDKYESMHLSFRYGLRTENTKNLFYCFKKTNENWSEPIQLTDSIKIYTSKIVVDGSCNIFIVYNKTFGEYEKSFLMMRKNLVWQEPFQISEDSFGWGFNPTLVIDSSNNVYAFYSNFSGIYWRKYENNSWSDVSSIITFPPALTALTTPLAHIDNNNFIHLVFKYYDENLHTAILYYMKYNGNRWTEKVSISTIDSLGGPRDYDFALDSYNNPHVVYTQLSNEWPSIILYYTRKTNGSWTIPENVTTQDSIEVYLPKIRINPITDKALIIAVTEKRHNPYFISNNRFIYDDGNNWVMKDILTDYPNYTGFFFDFLFDKQNNIHYVFTRMDTLAPALVDLYYTKGTLITGVWTTEKKKESAINLAAYPNPFNSSIVINYQIPKDEFVEIKIYDLLGSEIRKLVPENKAQGQHQISFDADNLPSGVYLVEMKAGKFCKTIKTLLIK